MLFCRPDLDLASSSSGLQLSGTTSPPSSSKGSRGRGRGRTRGRGSVRLAAPDSRVGHVKNEDQAAQSMPDATPAKAVQAHSALQIAHDVVDTAMPQAQGSDTELVSGGTNSQDLKAVVSAADLLKMDQKQPAMCAPTHAQVNSVDAVSTLQQPAEAFPVTKQHAADLSTLTAATTLKRSETFAEEDDYDADD